MFNEAEEFDSDVSQWDVSQVIFMNSTFSGSSAFQSDLSTWNVSNVEYMDAMFHRSVRFNSDISAWDVSNVKNMTAMFKLALSFNQSLCSWDALVHPTVATTSMFAASGCTDTMAPILQPANTSENLSWCHAC
jgi:surface protein